MGECPLFIARTNNEHDDDSEDSLVEEIRLSKFTYTSNPRAQPEPKREYCEKHLLLRHLTHKPRAKMKKEG
jgi:hypothetical protein